jgi:hypothetical protein
VSGRNVERLDSMRIVDEVTEYAIDGNDELRLELEIEADREARVQIVYEEDLGEGHAHAIPNPAKVYLRRRLSEFRDSFLCRNEYLALMTNKYNKYLIHKI